MTLAAGESPRLDLLVVGAGPTGLAIGAEALRTGLSALLVERGAITNALQELPTDMVFFSTRERLSIAGIPFPIPEERPTRRQALAYYRGVAEALAIPLALHEEVTAIRPDGGGFLVETAGRVGERIRRSRAVAIATGYYDTPRRLGVPGEEGERVRSRYREPYAHYRERVLVVGGGNSAAEAALDLWRAGAEVTLVHRGPSLKETVKYWLRPDFENRVAAGEIAARYLTRVSSFEDGGAWVEGPGGREWIGADWCYVLLGYEPDLRLVRASGVEIDEETGIPRLDPESCESNVPGLYIAGSLQAGYATHRIFIENSREHAPRLVTHLARRLGRS